MSPEKNTGDSIKNIEKLASHIKRFTRGGEDAVALIEFTLKRNPNLNRHQVFNEIVNDRGGSNTHASGKRSEGLREGRVQLSRRSSRRGK